MNNEAEQKKLTEIGLDLLISNINKLINTRINSIRDTLEKSVCAIKEVTNWTLEGDNYVANVTHILKTENIIVEAYEVSTKESFSVAKKIINDSTIKLTSTKNIPLKVILYNASIDSINITTVIDDSNIANNKCYSSDKTTKEIDKLKTSLTGEIENLKSSVSNGKTIIASAVTGKGVTTSNNASFQTIATNIDTIKQLPEIPNDCVGVIVDKNDKVVNVKDFELSYSFPNNTFGLSYTVTSNFNVSYHHRTNIENTMYYCLISNPEVSSVIINPGSASVVKKSTPIANAEYHSLTAYNGFLYCVVKKDTVYSVVKFDKEWQVVETLFNTNNVICHLKVVENNLIYFDETESKIKKTTFNNTLIKEHSVQNNYMNCIHVDKDKNIIYHTTGDFSKLNPDLITIWQKTQIPPNGYYTSIKARSIVTDSYGNIGISADSTSGMSEGIFFYAADGSVIDFLAYGGSNGVTDIICDKYDNFHYITSSTRYYSMRKIVKGKLVELGTSKVSGQCKNIVYIDEKLNFIIEEAGSQCIHYINATSIRKIATYEVIK